MLFLSMFLLPLYFCELPKVLLHWVLVLIPYLVVVLIIVTIPIIVMFNLVIVDAILIAVASGIGIVTVSGIVVIAICYTYYVYLLGVMFVMGIFIDILIVHSDCYSDHSHNHYYGWFDVAFTSIFSY